MERGLSGNGTMTEREWKNNGAGMENVGEGMERRKGGNGKMTE
jgi:hypothetical protein